MHHQTLARMMRTTWGDHDRFIDTYFTAFPNKYFSGDGAVLDGDGDYWLLGRIDDVVNISGHRLGTSEVGKRSCQPWRRS